jgi:hypothetical protein
MEYADQTIPLDEKGRKPVIVLTDRELLEEIVESQRATTDLVEKFIGDISKNPMMKMFGR